MLSKRTSLLSIVLIIIISTIYSINLFAQDNKDVFETYRSIIESKFDSTLNKHNQAFTKYRDSINNAFSTYLLKEWEQYSFNEYIQDYFKPEPKPITDTTISLSSTNLPHIEPLPEPPISTPIPLITPVSETKPIIQPIIPNTQKPTPPKNLFAFNYYGVNCEVNLPSTIEIEIKNTTKKEIKRVWDILSSETYDNYITDCIHYRDKLQLCDWGTYQFIVLTSQGYFGNQDCNESALFQIYALSQLGYKVRLGMQGDRLIPLIAFNQQIFSKPYILIDSKEFYCLSTTIKNNGIEICDFEFPNEQCASLHVSSLPILPYNPSNKRHIKSSAYPYVTAHISVNNNLIHFFNSYPNCSWELFAEASLSTDVKEQLYPDLEKIIHNLSEKDAANILLNLIQTGFEYKTDDEQFGKEKTFFGDEPFYYPYCDCEDRSILFAILVKDLLNLDIVLLDYPTHIATAVCFNEVIPGDYFNLDGKKYIICDPTYIGAPIGKSMPDMLKISAKILRIP